MSRLMILKASLNRNVLIAFLNWSKILMNLTLWGSQFHKYGVAAWKDGAPNVFSISYPLGGSK